MEDCCLKRMATKSRALLSKRAEEGGIEGHLRKKVKRGWQKCHQ